MTLVEPFEILSVQDVGDAHIRGAMGLAYQGIEGARSFIRESRNTAVVESALRIRAVETALYNLFGKGKLHGTIHTCLGQEFSGAVLGRYLGPDDYVTSNHRCHGHFIAATANWKGLVDEIIGNADGVCAGIGSSQHLWAPNFISNGQQGGLLPVAAGIALDRKDKGDGGVVFSFIGEGTLGEGIVYETMNLDALWTLPHVIVCENNFYSQSTAQGKAVSGSIAKRGEAFGLTVAEADIWNLPRFDSELKAAVDRARIDGRPTLIVLGAYRLNPHSKGDDQRDRQEIAWFKQHDPATIAIEEQPAFASLYTSFEREAEDYIESALRKPRLPGQRYFGDQLPRFDGDEPTRWTPLPPESSSDRRVVQQLNHLFDEALRDDDTAVFLGEDIDDPYGGAFKVARGLKTSFGPRVLTTPISEAAIVGVGIGLGITGRRAFVEIMFGDFITYAFDQIVNNASKIFHMYNRRLSCPLVVRTPMGGRRGYGPTHSQSLERFLIGIDNCCTISLSSIAPASLQLTHLTEIRCPTLLLENKIDYAARTYVPPDGVVVESDGALLPTLRVRLGRSRPTVTLLAYGGMARFVADALIDIFEQTDHVPELVVPTGLSPVNLFPVLDSLSRTARLVVIEEGAGYGSVGAELIAQIAEHGVRFESRRVSGKPTPVPSQPELEAEALPSIRDLCEAIATFERRSA